MSPHAPFASSSLLPLPSRRVSRVGDIKLCSVEEIFQFLKNRFEWQRNLGTLKSR
jgi:hypothetical protein